MVMEVHQPEGDLLDDNGNVVGIKESRRPRLFFVAKRDIYPKEELLYDYNDTSRVARKECPWIRE